MGSTGGTGGIHPKLISLISEGSRVRAAGHGVMSEWRQGCPFSPLPFIIFMDSLARQVIEAKGMHDFDVAFRISSQVVNSPSEELLSMLMLLYADDLVLLAPSRSDLTPSRSWLGWLRGGIWR